MVCAGFELSEKYQVPVIVRTTTRTAHTLHSGGYRLRGAQRNAGHPT